MVVIETGLDLDKPVGFGTSLALSNTHFASLFGHYFPPMSLEYLNVTDRWYGCNRDWTGSG